MIPDWCELTYQYGPRGTIVFGYADEQKRKLPLPLCPLSHGRHAWQPSGRMPWHWILEPCSALRPWLDPADVPLPDNSDFKFCGGCGKWFQTGWHTEEHDKICPNGWWD